MQYAIINNQGIYDITSCISICICNYQAYSVCAHLSMLLRVHNNVLLILCIAMLILHFALLFGGKRLKMF